MIPSQQDIQKIRQGNERMLERFDERGLFAAPGESAEAFADRLETLRNALLEFDGKLAGSDGVARLEELAVRNADRIPEALAEAPRRATEELYGFRCDWVPGFFCSPGCSWLFGGCTFSYPPELFTVFIIGEKLRKKKKYLCYDRDEILAHELCHVARAGLGSTEFEEHFAYQTAKNAFRRHWGGIMHSRTDSLVFLMACVLLLAIQSVRTLLPSLPLPPALGWVLFATVVLFFILRQLRTDFVFQKALRHLTDFCRGDLQNARMLLLHATDDELREFARTAPQELPALFLTKRYSDLRWTTARKRLPKE